MSSSVPTLHLMTGLPASGKTTRAREIEPTESAIVLSPDEWLRPLFGTVEVGDRRDVIEARFIELARRLLRSGVSVVLDFGFWAPEERWALRRLAELEGADCRIHYLAVAESDRRRCLSARGDECDAEVQDQYVGMFVPPSQEELLRTAEPSPPLGTATWLDWASTRWPGLLL